MRRAEARRSAYLATGPEMVRFLADLGFEWDFSPFPDYYPEAPGASYGRGVGAKLFDGSVLGPWRKTMRSMVRIPAIVVLPHEFKSMLMPTKNLRSLINGSSRVAHVRLADPRQGAVSRPGADGTSDGYRLRGIEVRLNTGHRSASGRADCRVWSPAQWPAPGIRATLA